MEKLPLKTKLIYSAGNLGIATITVMHMLYLVYFFFPPSDAGIPYLIPQGNFFLGLTIFGLIISVGKVVDAFFDPIIANFSDGLKHRLGKRIPMMRLAALPFALCYALVFFVPHTSGVDTLNILWLACFLLLSALFFTSYMIPFYSLMVDIAKSSDDKVDLGTISSAFWFVGFLLVSFTTSLWDVIANVFEVSRLESIRITFMFTALVGFAFLMVPALLIDERKYTSSEVDKNDQKLLASLAKVIGNRSFRFYLVANTCYTVATILFESGLIYFLTVLALQEAALQGPLTTIIGVMTLLCYPLVNAFAKRRGKSSALRLALLLFALTFGVISSLGISGVHAYLLLGLVVLLSPFAQAAFGILPMVITSDCAAYDQYKTGEDSAGMYVAANGFCVKLGGSLGLVFFTSLLLFGKDVGNDLGIRIATLFGAGVSLVGMLFLSQYDEAEIQTYNSVDSKNSAYQ